MNSTWYTLKKVVFVTAPCTPICQNGGLCIARDVCKCPPEYMGERCQFPLCRPPCINDGHCVRPNVCMCPAAWKGDHCQKPVCHLPCLNGGRYRALSHCSRLDDLNAFLLMSPLKTCPYSVSLKSTLSSMPLIFLPNYNKISLNSLDCCLHVNPQFLHQYTPRLRTMNNRLVPN